jgi:plasmid replication initiation protein
MSEQQTNNTSNAIEVGKLILQIIAVVSAVKFLNEMFGKGKAGQENESSEAQAAAARQKLFKEIPPSYNDQLYRDWADTLDKALLRDSTEDEEAVYSVFEEVKNISDVAKLIEFFGHRREMFTTYYISLPQAITSTFNAREKLKLNNILRQKKIEYRFK